MILFRDYELDAYILSDIGLCREKNEDNCLLAYSIVPDIKVLMAVADGVRNNAVSEIASKIVIEKIKEYYMNKEAIFSDEFKNINNGDFLIKTIEQINTQILLMSQKIKSYSNMAATLAVSIITKNNRFIGLTVGDTYLYRYHGRRLTKLCGSEPLSSIKEPDKHVIGVSKELSYTIKEFRIERGDIYLTATDGAVRYEKFNEEALKILLNNNTDSREICNAFVRSAISNNVKDNITLGAIIVK